MKKQRSLLLLAGLLTCSLAFGQGGNKGGTDLSGVLSGYLATDTKKTGRVAPGQDARFPEGRFIVPPQESAMGRAVQGTADFEKVRALNWNEPEANLSRKIGHIELGDALCSGFLVGPDLFLTNHHCVWDENRSAPRPEQSYQVYMDYLFDENKGPVSSKVHKILKMDQGLDYALLQLERELGVQYGWLRLQEGQPPASGNVTVIQHPQGRSKEVARQNANILKTDPTVVHYLADTEGGSSGSPVFLQGSDQVIALHHVGVSGRYNEGVLMGRIIPEIRQWLPKGKSEGTGREPGAEGGHESEVGESIRQLLRAR
ncbi:MAG: serine protease [Gammaproteobacteria bacterium]|nr:serine protease [Gammaproteobacteria bacterium]MBU1656189.1 serine protease [Gammaproteobacteria bacterium]MBU1960449.1 serine protease [Gammaproteobacteria bacterium]